MKFAAFLAALSIAGCANAIDLPADAKATLNPIDFFAGRTRGEGVVHKLIGSDSRILVESVGRSDGPGGLVLQQTIREGSKPARQRTWLVRRQGTNRFTGTLTDAVGPVAVRVTGPRATIRYTMKNGLVVDQQLALQPDRRTILNRLIVSKLGIRLARLEETIRKLD
jgi:hypothetical protein